MLLTWLAAGPVYAACTSPAGNERDIIYNGDYNTYQFCNGTRWMGYGGGSSCTASGGYNPTAPSGSGYFVLTSTTWNGNLGGLSGADAKCLTELTANTAWMGYATANSNGQLVATKVHAFLCAGSNYSPGMCNNPMPLTTYYFSNAGNGAAGGASFTTDSNGLGPGDSANWSAANYFSGSYDYWTDRAYTSSALWAASGRYAPGESCSSWSTASSGSSGGIGNAGQTDQSRWNTNSDPTCDNTYRLICMVNP